MNVGLAIFLIIIMNLVVISFVFFLIKYFIRYSNQLKRKKSQQQAELDRMNVEDL